MFSIYVYSVYSSISHFMFQGKKHMEMAWFGLESKWQNFRLLIKTLNHKRVLSRIWTFCETLQNKKIKYFPCITNHQQFIKTSTRHILTKLTSVHNKQSFTHKAAAWNKELFYTFIIGFNTAWLFWRINRLSLWALDGGDDASEIQGPIL